MYGWPEPKWNLSASSAPTSGDDIDDGYEPLSLWLKQDSGDVYINTSNARGAATWLHASSSVGTVTSVGLSAPAEFTVSGSPVTTSGTLTFTKANQSANTVWAGPISGAAAAPTFRTLSAYELTTRWEPLGDGDTTDPDLLYDASGNPVMVLVSSP